MMMKKFLISITFVVFISVYALFVHSYTIRNLSVRLNDVEHETSTIKYDLVNTKLILEGMTLQQEKQQKLMNITLENLITINKKLDSLIKKDVDYDTTK